MRHKHTWHRWLTWGSKALILGVLVFTVFSPFGQVFSVPTASAELICRSPGSIAGQWINWGSPDANGKCFAGVLWDTAANDGAGDWVATNTMCDNLSSCVAGIVYVFTVGLGTVMAYLGAWILSLAIALSLNSAAYALTFLTEGWTIVRDIANMFFILILVYIAFTVMFRAQTSETMQRLAWVIVIALLINFSFFFVRVVIDAGNLLAVQFYNAIPADPLVKTIQEGGAAMGGTVAAATTYVGAGETTKDLTSKIMEGIGVQNILNTDSFKKFREQNNVGILGSWEELIALTVVYIAVGAVLFILAAMFFTVGIKFIVRVAVLWLLLIASPLALIARTVKKGEQYYDQWQDALIKHAFYPAVFLFIFYVLILFMEQLAEGGTVISQTFLSVNNTSYSNWFVYIVQVIANIGIRLGFVVVLLYIGLKASEAIGVYGANFARNASNWATRRGAAVGFGTLGFAGRNTIGAMGGALNRSQMARDLEKRAGIVGLFGRGLRGTGNWVGSRSFDVRNVEKARAGASTLGFDIGKPGRADGYIQRTKAAADAMVKRGKDLEPTEGEKLAAQEQAKKELRYEETKATHEAERREAEKERQRALDKMKDLRSRGIKDGVEMEAAQAHVDHQNEVILTSGNKIKVLDESLKVRSKELSGEGKKEAYARNLITPSVGNAGLITRSSREAAAQLLKKKGAKDKAKEALKAYEEEEGGGEEKPSGGSGDHKSSGGGPQPQASQQHHTGGAGVFGLSEKDRAALQERQLEVQKGMLEEARKQTRGIERMEKTMEDASLHTNTPLTESTESRNSGGKMKFEKGVMERLERVDQTLRERLENNSKPTTAFHPPKQEQSQPTNSLQEQQAREYREQ